VKILPDAMRGPLYRVYERRLTHYLDPSQNPRHVAIICDGNRRWARAAGFENVNHGHRVGAQKIAEVLSWCSELGIETVTIYLLSTENLSRDSAELGELLQIVPDIVEEISAPGQPWRVQIVGALDQLPDQVSARLKAAQQQSAGRVGPNVNVAVGYGGRQEIVDSVRSLLSDRIAAGDTPDQLIDAVTVEAIDQNLYTRGQPDPDLVIRTSGEQRLSGFLLWQSAYSEIWFTDAYWPAFRRVDFLRALRDYAARSRRFGK
jgi:short-chain Z-isoprenyl diphosphate synthase